MLKLSAPDRFVERHIGINKNDIAAMLQTVGVSSLEELIDQTVPSTIRSNKVLDIPDAVSEYQYLNELKAIAAKNKVFKTYIGLGYHDTITPAVILRNIFENPGWYTQYTPYQAEIAQGRLEALLNFQTMVSDLTAMPMANASLLDEGTAAAEAMAMFFGLKNKRKVTAPKLLVSDAVLPQTLDVLKTRAIPLGIEVVIQNVKDFDLSKDVYGILLQYPAAEGSVEDYRALAEEAKAKKIYVTVAADLMSLALLTPPGEWGADAVVGNTQRFGVPMGYGGPHAAFFATHEKYKRQIPGRIIGVSIDRHGNPALRMALQTREQHIKRERATSNICTAQALLAIMSGMYAVYHGPERIKAIAERIHGFAQITDLELSKLGYNQLNDAYFDTIKIEVENAEAVKTIAEANEINFYYPNNNSVVIALNETTNHADVQAIVNVFAEAKDKTVIADFAKANELDYKIPTALVRETAYLTHPIFNTYHSESQMMRYVKSLENKDLSLTHSMISSGSCTMKLNAAAELIPVSWREFGGLHPFIPINQAEGYTQIFEELEAWLCQCTGFTACSLQPNSGAQGEYTGLMTIRAYHEDRGDFHRNVAIIPSSAHGTNPASAVMAGMKVVVTKCDENGNIDLNDLRDKVEANSDNLACLMVTYPSTHGVFEVEIKAICDLIHEHGGRVYMDGANMNAQVGLTSPNEIGADVCHLNLHKTFAIPHGGGGPGMGPICVNDSLKPYLPTHTLISTGGEKGISAVSAAPWGSASILLISYGYIKMLGAEGVTDATKYAILTANYIKSVLEGRYQVLYTGEYGRSAHELILNLKPYKELGVTAEDIAKRLMDYGFHAPTLAFPVPDTVMIEPTESEDKAELDRFCDAMMSIHNEIDAIGKGDADAENNVLKNAPHTLAEITNDTWEYPYSREAAAFPLPYVRKHKFWASVGRVNNAHGDRNLICACTPIEAYM
ncbi:MAG: aminomethyl-transferring glycine dehydrogenase [Saprospiraceae bacterium]